MALNFRISARKNKGDLYLRLAGNFDGSSALELINTVQSQTNGIEKIIIDTNGLAAIHPFGLGVFTENPVIHKRRQDLQFTGKYGDTLTPQAGCSV